MMSSIAAPFPAALARVLREIALDPAFDAFLAWAAAHRVPVVVLSSGLEPIIRALLERDLGAERAARIEVVANAPVLDKSQAFDGWSEQGGWGIRFRDESAFGHDKARAIRPYKRHFEGAAAAERPTMLYAGDGVSDLSAARETDLLFAKEGRDLVTYCEREGVPFTLFEDWTSILEKTKEI